MNMGKMDELLCRLKEGKVDIVGIAESWAHEEILDAELTFEGYKCFRRDRDKVEGQKRKGGGVLLYVKEELNSYMMGDVLECEAIWVGVKTMVGEVKIGVCYRSPAASIDETRNLFMEIRKQCRGTTIIMGDFNYKDIDWINGCGKGEGEDFMDLVHDCFLHQHVMEPTRGDSILDLVLSSEQGLVQEVKVDCPVANSDHNVITFVIPLQVYHKGTGSKTVYKYHKADYVKVCRRLQSIDWASSTGNIEQMWKKFKSEFIECREQYVPNGRRVRKTKNAAWMKRNILRGIKRRGRLWRNYVERPTHENRCLYIKQRNQTCAEIKGAKRDFEFKLADNIKEDPKSFYAYVRTKSKSKSGIGPLKDENGRVIDGNDVMAQLLNNYFSSVFTREDLENIPHTEENDDEHILCDIDITAERVFKAIGNMKLNKAAGPDELTSTFIKGSVDGVVLPLVDIFRKSFEEGEIPQDWKMADVTAIYKKGNRSDSGNYRPVSLTSNIGKILERIFKEDIVKFLEENSKIRNTQHGFRSKRSCLTNLLEFMEYVAKRLDEGKPVDSIYLDFQKAFDKVPHRRLLVKLKAIGIRGKLLKWIKHWLSGRKQRVVINGVESDWRDVLSGVPQGSILGPLLFIIYINDIDEGIFNKILKFADDTKLVGKVGSMEDIEELRKDLARLFEWSEKWQMKFNLDKCKVMHIGSRNSKAEYLIGGKKLDTITEEKDLGVIISSNFKVANQCRKAANKGNQILGLINRAISCKGKRVILSLYKALVRPHLEYCIQAWRPHLVKDIEILEKVQRRATKMIEECTGRTYQERLNILRLTTLETRRERADMVEVFKILNRWEGLEENMFFERAEGGITRGHQLKLYKEGCKKDWLKFSFGHRVIDKWNKLPEYVVSCLSMNAFKTNVDKWLGHNWGK